MDELEAALADFEVFCTDAGVDLKRIEPSSTALARLTLVAEAANTLIAPDERRKAYLAQSRLAERRRRSSLSIDAHPQRFWGNPMRAKKRERTAGPMKAFVSAIATPISRALSDGNAPTSTRTAMSSSPHITATPSSVHARRSR